MKKQFFILFALVFQLTVSHAQQVFIDQVSIDFTKTVSWLPLAKEMFPEWYENEKDHMAKENVSVFNFTGDGSKSIYKRIKEPERQQGVWSEVFADENVVYNEYGTGMTTIQKPIYEETYLMQDTMLKIKWKITADTRTIAGFNCRKAIGFLFDTVAVFAFYTDEIMINGGPEGFHGLPGMILGIGVPRLHTTWFANKISITGVNMKSVIPAVKGKKTTRTSMLSTLTKAMKNWDQWGQKMLLAFVI
jgi:GLPGLI family protein